MSIKRYKLFSGMFPEDPPEEREDKNGYYVLYSDYEKEVKKLKEKFEIDRDNDRKQSYWAELKG